jgi:2-keto-4-pentenoate hydratase
MTGAVSDPLTAGRPVQAATDRILRALAEREPCEPVRDLIGPTDLTAAYQVQQALVAARVRDGARVVGRKIGATSAAVQRQLGVDRPDLGVLLDEMDVTECQVVPGDRLIQPRVEAEVAFVLSEDLADGPLDHQHVRAAVDHALAALEVVDSRIRNWDISFADTVADNASSGLFVLGELDVDLSDFEPREVEMTLAVNGRVVSVGDGAACLGDPLTALSWLARQARDLGDALRAGQVILSGALGPFVSIRQGDEVVATLDHLGEVTAQF